MNKQDKLIFDVGMHKGEDTEYYLKKGFNVVSFEADPDLANYGRERFKAAIADGKFHSEQEIAKHFYPSSTNKEQADSYRHLKATLIQRLTNALFLTDVKQASYNSYQRAYYECHKNWAAIKILLGRNARTVAIKLAEKTLKYAIKYEFSDLCLNICKVLRLHFNMIDAPTVEARALPRPAFHALPLRVGAFHTHARASPGPRPYERVPVWPPAALVWRWL